MRSPHRGTRSGRSRERERARNGTARTDEKPASASTEDNRGAAGAGGRQPPAGPRGGAKRAGTDGQGDTKMSGTNGDAAVGANGLDDEEAQIAQVMGFANFRTTKNTKVPGNEKNYGIRKEKKVQYRQYMNRVGGFNRPLSPSAT